MKREESKEELKWDLTKVYKSKEEWDEDFQKFKELSKQYPAFRGKLSDKEHLLTYLKLNGKFLKLSERLSAYTSLAEDIDVHNSVYQEMSSMYEDFGSKFDAETAFIDVELSKLSAEFIDECLKDERFKTHRLYLEAIKESAKHTLSEKEEQLYGLVGSFAGGFSAIRDCLYEKELKFDPVIVDGEEKELTIENAIVFYKNKDREVRKQAYLNIQKGLSDKMYSGATAYIYNLKMSSFDLKLRNYSTYLDTVLERARIPKEVYYKLIEKTRQNVDIKDEYYKLIKEFYNFDHMYGYDAHLSLSKKSEKVYTFDEQIEIMKKAFAPLGEDYVKMLDQAVKDRWFDVYSSSEKATGGYCCYIYGENPHILLNSNDDYDSLTTIAHEFGHGVHGYLSIKNQPFELYDMPIYLAEIASTTNEILLNKFLIASADNVDDKIFYLENGLKTALGTINTQVMYSEFEDYAHKLIENNEPISPEILNNKWKELSDYYSGKTIESFGNSKNCSWTSIRHFFYNYYVYKYATSYTCANYIATKILSGDKEMLKKYMEFLASGGNDYPNEILHKMGIYLENGEAYDVVFNDIRNSLTELKTLVKMRGNHKEKEISNNNQKKTNDEKLLNK